MSYVGNTPFTAAFLTDTFSGNGSTVAFTMSVAPASTSSVIVAVTGVLQDPSTYSVSGTTLTFSAAPPTGTSNISVRYLGIPASGVTTTAYRTVTDTTATAGQTTFSIPSYTVGYINVFRNGALLAGSDYTATSGTTVVLNNAASAGDTITTESFYVSSVLNALANTGGTLSGQLTINSATGQKPLIAQVNGTEVMEVDASGNVGIGTSSPSTYGKLAVVGGSGNGIAYNDGTVTAYLGTSGSNLGLVGTTTNHPFAFYTNATERMRIDSSGNVGIGTNAPSQKLEVRGGITTGYSSGQGVYYYNSDGTNSYEIYNAGATGSGNPVLSFYQIGTGERMRIDSSGNVGIGTSSPSYKLDIATASDGRVFFNSLSTGGKPRFATILNGTTNVVTLDTYGASTDPALAFSTAATERMRIDSSGNLLVGKTALNDTTAGAQIAGTGATYPGRICATVANSTNATEGIVVYSSTAGAYRFYVSMDGKVNATNTTIAAISDQRLKENIRDLDDGLSSIMALQPRKFDWKDGKGADIKNARGFIAQEFETVFPDLIDTWKDPAPEGEEPYKSVRADLIPSLVKAIQEQQALIQQLQADVAALKGNS